MGVFIYSIGFLLEHIKYLILYMFILKVPAKNKKWSGIIMLIGSVIMSLAYFHVGYGAKCIIYLILLIIESFLFLKEKIVKILMLSLWSFCTISCLTGIMEESLAVFFYSSGRASTNEMISDSISQTLTVLVLLVMWQILGKRFHYKKMSTKYYILVIVVLALNCFELVMLDGTVDNEKNIIKVIFVETAYVILSIFAYVQLVLIMYLSVTKDAYKEKDEMNKKYLQAEEEHYLYLEKREQETKKFRHDIRNHLDALMELCNEGNMEQVQSYLQSMSGRVNEYSRRISVNYNIADAIINQYMDLCEKEEITLKVSGHFPADCLIDPFDACTVISNMLKNARTAALESRDKWIQYIIKYNEESREILLKMQNTYNGTACFESTTKEDKINHGYGLNNIKEVVERYHGFFAIKEINGIVETNVMLKNIPLAQKNDHWRK